MSVYQEQRWLCLLYVCGRKWRSKCDGVQRATAEAAEQLAEQRELLRVVTDLQRA